MDFAHPPLSSEHLRRAGTHTMNHIITRVALACLSHHIL